MSSDTEHTPDSSDGSTPATSISSLQGNYGSECSDDSGCSIGAFYHPDGVNVGRRNDCRRHNHRRRVASSRGFAIHTMTTDSNTMGWTAWSTLPRWQKTLKIFVPPSGYEADDECPLESARRPPEYMSIGREREIDHLVANIHLSAASTPELCAETAVVDGMVITPENEIPELRLDEGPALAPTARVWLQPQGFQPTFAAPARLTATALAIMQRPRTPLVPNTVDDSAQLPTVNAIAIKRANKGRRTLAAKRGMGSLRIDTGPLAHKFLRGTRMFPMAQPHAVVNFGARQRPGTPLMRRVRSNLKIAHTDAQHHQAMEDAFETPVVHTGVMDIRRRNNYTSTSAVNLVAWDADGSSLPIPGCRTEGEAHRAQL